MLHIVAKTAGERNIRAATEYLTKHGLAVSHASLGGTFNRNVHLAVGTGEVSLKTAAGIETFSLGA